MFHYSRRPLTVQVSHQFMDVLHQSSVVIGLAGTANEQAMFAGRPLISFIGTGPQSTKKRFVEQHQLIDGATTYLINSNNSNSLNNNGNLNFNRNGSMNNIHNVEKTMQKYQQLAKDAQSNGDPVLAQNYLQHADHYLRRYNELNDKRENLNKTESERSPLNKDEMVEKETQTSTN